MDGLRERINVKNRKYIINHKISNQMDRLGYCIDVQERIYYSKYQKDRVRGDRMVKQE
jgi:hypothetical protein